MLKIVFSYHTVLFLVWLWKRCKLTFMPEWCGQVVFQQCRNYMATTEWFSWVFSYYLIVGWRQQEKCNMDRVEYKTTLQVIWQPMKVCVNNRYYHHSCILFCSCRFIFLQHLSHISCFLSESQCSLLWPLNLTLHTKDKTIPYIPCRRTWKLFFWH